MSEPSVQTDDDVETPPKGVAAANGVESTPQPPEEDEVASYKLFGTLALAGALSGLLLVLVHQATQPAILAHKAKMLKLAVQEVLQGPPRYETLFLVDGKLQDSPPEGVNERDAERVFVGFDDAGKPAGFAIASDGPGFQDTIKLIFGYDLKRNQTLGMKVLQSKETPGLGDKIEKDLSFVDQFKGAQPPLVLVKPGSGSGAKNEIDGITGATISSRAIVRILNAGLDTWQKPLSSQKAGGRP